MDDQSLHVLLVEDNPTDAFLLKKTLAAETSAYVFTHAKRLDEALQYLQNESFGVVLLDLGLPDSQGIETFNRMQRSHSETPILILSGLEDEKLAVTAVRNGAQDFLVKGKINGSVLSRTISYAIERKLSEQKLIVSEASYRRLFESTHDGIFILDAVTGQITDANPYLEELLGYTTTEFIGKRLWEIAPFRDKEANQAAFRTLQEKGYIRYDDLPLMTKDGKQASVEFISNVYAVGSHRVIQCNIRDITERKQAEAAALELKRFLQATIDALPAHLAVLDETGKIIAVNQAWRQFSDQNEGTAASCGVGANYIAVSENASGPFAEEGAEVGQGIRSVLNGESEAFCLEYPCHSPTKERWFNVCATPFTSEGVMRVLVAHDDITTRTKAETLIHASEANLVRAQKMAHLGNWNWTLQEVENFAVNPLSWSDEVFRIFGYQPGEVEASYELFVNGVHPDDRAGVEAMLHSAIETGRNYNIEHRVVRPDGTERTVQERSDLIYDENGRPINMVGTVQDITGRKLAEQELLQSEARFRTAISQAPVPIMIHREDGQVLQISKGWTEYSGYGIEDIPTIRDWVERAYGEESAGAYEFIQTLYEVEETSSAGEWEIEAKNGEKRVWDFITTPLGTFGDDQRVVINTAFDVTESKRAQEALEATTREIVTIWESMTDAFFSLDTEWRFTHVNQQTALLWNRNAEELIGKDIWEEFPAAVGTKFQAEYSRAAAEQVVVNFEACYAPDNAWRDVHVYPSTIGLSVYFRDITERKQAETLLQESQQRLALATESARIGIWDWNVVENKMVWDAQMRVLYGISEQDFTGAYDSWQNGLHPRDRDKAEADLNFALNGSGDFQSHFRVIWSNGEVHHIEAHGIVQRNESGVAQRMIGVNWDVTERKEAEEERDRFFTLSLDMLAIIGSDGYMKRLNPAFEATLGFSNAELMAVPFINFVHPDDHAITQEGAARLISGFPVSHFENRYRCRDGSYKWLRWTCAPFESLWYCVAHDVTEVKRTEQTIRESEEYFRFLNELSEATRLLSDPEQIMAVMARMLGEYLNASRCAYADVEPDGEEFTIVHDYTDGSASTVGKYQLSLFGPRAVTTLNSGATLIIRNMEGELLPDEGTEMFQSIGIEAIVVCPLVKDGVLRAMMAVHQATPRDWQPSEITLVQDVVERCWATIERRAAEERIYQLNADLEHRVIERTTQLELANTDLNAARETADTANLAKSEFLSRMSHELRTPLNAILGFGQILDKKELDPLARESVGHILKGGRHLLVLINEVLDIARVEAGRMELSLEPVALADLVSEVCALVQPIADERAIQLQENTSQLWGMYALADQQRLKQVLINLLSNAIKFNRESGHVEISCEQTPGKRIAIAMRDTGPGIAPENLSKLFVPFQRLGADSSKIEGTGLGLILSQRLMSAMDGTLTVESIVGTGTTATIELPQSNAPEAISAKSQASGYHRSVASATEATYCVLCIEDNPSNLRLMEALFEDRPKTQLLTAIQGSIGLKLALQHEPDLILLDLNLPDIDGSEVLERLKNSVITRDIPVVVVSADATPNQIERLMNAGAKDYLTKPIDVSRFLQMLDRFLQPASNTEISMDKEPG